MATESLPVFRISVDNGNGQSTLVWCDHMGKFHVISVASVRAQVQALSIGLKAFEQDYTWYEWRGDKYVVGDDTVRYGRDAIERHMGENRYGGDISWFMVAVLLAQAGFKGGNFHLTLYAPPGRYEAASKSILSAAKKNKKLSITVKGDTEPRVFNIEKVTVQSETVAALGVLMFTPNGKPIKYSRGNDPLAGAIYLNDLGAETADTIIVVDGVIDSDRLQFATEPKGGIDARIRVPLMTALHGNENKAFKKITVDDIDYIMRNPAKSESHMKRIIGEELDIAPTLKRMYEKNYWGWHRSYIDTRFDGYRGASGAAFFGGGGIITQPYWKQDFKDIALDLVSYACEYPGLEKITPADLNAVGGWLLYPVFG